MDLKSNEPYWPIKNGLPTSFPSLQEDTKCSVLIVGGGITGSLLAHQMISDGYDTILIDKREVVHGSSSATTALLQYEIDVQLHQLIELIGEKGAVSSYLACAKSIDTLESISLSIQSRAGFEKKESLYFATSKKASERLQKELKVRLAAGIEVEFLQAEEIKEKFGIEKSYGGLLSKKAASVDAYKLAFELLEFNTKKGLRVFDRTELNKVEYLDQGVLVHTSSGAKITADKIIYCTGYETSEMIKEKFVKLKSTYAMVSEEVRLTTKSLSETVFWNTEDPYLYFRTTKEGRILVGGGDEDFKDSKRRDRILDKKEKELLRELNKYLPKISFPSDYVWAGTFGETKDGLPYIGDHKDFPFSYFVLGFGGNGITFSVTGMEMASLYMKGQVHELSEYYRYGR